MDHILWISCAASILMAVLALLTKRGQEKLPPGPKGISVFGSLFDTPRTLLFVKLSEWADQYGGILSYKIMGQTVVVLNTAKEAADVLDRLSAKTSDRPALIKAGEFLCRNMEWSFLPRGERWRLSRRAAHECLNARAVEAYIPVLNQEAAQLVQGLLDCPELPVSQHVHRVTSSIAWRVLFGREAIHFGGPDPSARVEKMAIEMTAAMLPGGAFVDVFPAFKPIIANVNMLRSRADLWYEELFSHFRHAYDTPQVTGMPSVAGRFKEIGKRLDLDPHTGAWGIGTLFFAAQDTSVQTACALLWFIDAAILYPTSLVKVRKELFAVVGDRPPDFADRPRLPQLEALVTEVLRWRPPAPLSVAHAASETFEYGEYTIPKGAIVMANIFAITRNPELYPDGERFDPSRFIDEQGNVKQPLRDTKDDYLCFGHGRRICVGKDLAINTLWITIAYLIWAFDIGPEIAEDGSVVNLPTPDISDKGASIEPFPFSARFTPRMADIKERLKNLV